MNTSVAPKLSRIILFGFVSLLLSFFYQYGLRALGNRVGAIDRAIVDFWRTLGDGIPLALCAGLGFLFYRQSSLTISNIALVILVGGLTTFLGWCAWVVACPLLAECI